MVATIPTNPYVTTAAQGVFNAQSKGLVQGDVYPDPAIRYKRAGGVLASTETLPMYGGVGVYVDIPGVSGGPSAALGATVGRATALTGGSTPLLGFSTFEGAYAMVNTPASPVPMIGSYGQVMYYRLGSGARIIVACDPALATLYGDPINSQVSWDFNNQILQPYDASTATYAISTMTWSSANAGQIAVVMSVASLVGAVGDEINISGATNSGTGGNSAVNGDFVVTAFIDNEHFTIAAPAASGAITTIGGSPVINAGTGALNVDVLEVQVGNCMTVSYNSVTGFASWNFNGSCAVILI
jgi:hypothetical protein